jgi:Ser/Thr protein kinase RdoA (MazF antagonist)
VHLWLRNRQEPVSETPNGAGIVNVGDVARVATALGLGSLQREPTNLKPADSNPVWAAETDRGQWIIKTAVPPGAWWFEAMSQAGALELAARHAGIATPQPADERGDAGLWHDVSGDVYARAYRWVVGHHPDVPLDPNLASWLGHALAAIERTQLPADPYSDSGYRLHPQAEWREWITEAVAAGRLDAAAAAGLEALVSDLNDVIASGRGQAAIYQRLHRDVSALNILVTDSGPVLLDFDHSGPQVPWWEFVADSFDLSSPALGLAEPSRTTVDAALAAYMAAGGVPGPADATAFTGMLAARLSFAAYLLWISCGHRGCTADHQSQATKALQEALVTLPALQKGIARWATWLA